MHRSRHTIRWLPGLLFAAVFLWAGLAHGQTVNLILHITTPLTEADGTTPLQDGSVVYLIGNQSGNVNPMETFGDALIANSTTGDDILVAQLVVDSSGTAGAGTIFTSISGVDVSQIDYFYLRFFDYQDSAPPTGEGIPWGTTVPEQYTEDFGLAFFDTEGAPITRTNDFIVIPEPGTMHLFVAAGLLLALLGARRERTAKKPLPSRGT